MTGARDHDAPRVTHFNDCAMVGLRLVEAAARAGLQWKYLPPEEVRPPEGFAGTSLPRQLPYVLRHWNMLRTSDVLHIHYATAHHLLTHGFMPQRPYVLHLHGSDIRIQWKSPEHHDVVQRAIDGAHTVLYANRDTRDDALAARPDALYMPAPIDVARLPLWRPSEGDRRRIVFASRWDQSKGVETQLEVARGLRAAHGATVDIVGIDWGPGAAAARDAGVDLVPRLANEDYLALLASADMVIGQAAGILAVSELEAMAIGPVVACPVVSEFIEPAAPVIQGSVADIIDVSLDTLADPRAASERLDARRWVSEFHSADLRVPELAAIYAQAAGL